MGKKYKLPLTVGFAALCDHIKAIKKTADQSGSAVTELAVAVDTTVAEIDNVKAGKDQLHWYGTCTTAAATAAKVVTLSGTDDFDLRPGASVTFKCSYTNTASNPTLNVNGTGAKPVWYASAAVTTGNLGYATYANRYITYVYDGTYWVWQNWGSDNNTTYSNASLGQGYGTCATAAATAAKVVTLSGYALTTGGLVAVKFTNANTASNPTLNINSKGAKAIYYKGAALTDTTLIQAGDTCLFLYNGSYYHLLAIDRDADAVEDIRDALKEKQNVNPAVAFTIPTSGWSTDSSVSGYTKCYDVTVAGLLDTDVVAVDVAPASENVARAANFTQTQSYAGKFRLRAEKVPTAAITAQYRVINTVAYKEGT